jgi:NHLM bacteriocin system secretion protein
MSFKRINSPDDQKDSVSNELDQMMTVVNSKGWIALACCCSLLFILLLWTFLGNVPMKVGGWGIIRSPVGAYIVVAQTAGIVVDIEVNAGQFVKPGDLLVKTIDLKNDLTIQLQKEKVSLTELELTALKQQIEQENQARQLSIKKKIESVELSKNNTLARIPFLENDLAAKKRLAEKGVLARPDVEKANAELLTARNTIEAYEAEEASLNADLTVHYRLSEIKAKEEVLDSAKRELEKLLLQQSFSLIKTEKAGKVLEIDVSIGKNVEPGQMITSIELPLQPNQKLEFYTLIGAEYGVLLKAGLNTQIEVAGIDPKQYGYLLGKVIYVSPFPVSQQEVFSEVPNLELSQFLRGKNEAVYSLIVELFPDPTMSSGFKWTTNWGPPNPITTGTLGVARVIVQERRPIFYILPQEIGPYVREIMNLSINRFLLVPWLWFMISPNLQFECVY